MRDVPMRIGSGAGGTGEIETRADEHRRAVRWSSGGRTWVIVLRGRKGQAVDRFVVRVTGYSLITKQYALAARQRYQPTLLLTTIGRRTGELRTRALPYYRDGERVVVVGSNGGGPRDPDWVWNVRGNPAGWVRIRRRLHAVDAHVASGEERERLFERLGGGRGSIRRYQERASTYGRDIPFVVLTPRDGKPLVATRRRA